MVGLGGHVTLIAIFSDGREGDELYIRVRHIHADDFYAYIGHAQNFAKAAVNGFTKCLSREAAQFGISVNGIAAGIFDTDLGNTLPEKFRELYTLWCSAGRLGRAEELAEFAVFMVSDRNSYMNGEIVIVDGGAIT